MPAKRLKATNELIWGYKFTQPIPRGYLWKEVRKHLGLSQTQMAQLVGLSQDGIKYRERIKRQYSMQEITLLHQVSQLSATDFLALVDKCAPK